MSLWTKEFLTFQGHWFDDVHPPVSYIPVCSTSGCHSLLANYSLWLRNFLLFRAIGSMMFTLLFPIFPFVLQVAVIACWLTIACEFLTFQGDRFDDVHPPVSHIPIRSTSGCHSLLANYSSVSFLYSNISSSESSMSAYCVWIVNLSRCLLFLPAKNVATFKVHRQYHNKTDDCTSIECSNIR